MSTPGISGPAGPLYWHRFAFTFSALEDLRLPEYKGSMYRGVFGITFRHTVCVTRKPDCAGCMLQPTCSYFRVFETEVPHNGIWFLQGVLKVPHPFIIHPGEDNRRFIPEGGTLQAGLTIIGDAIQFLPFFIYTFRQLGERGLGAARGRVALLSAESVNGHGERRQVYSRETDALTPGLLPMRAAELPLPEEELLPELTLHFTAPWRVQRNGRVLVNPAEVTPALLFHQLAKRLYALAELFCGGAGQPAEAPPLPEGLAITSNRLAYKAWERYSNRQHTKISLGGFVGTLTLANVPRGLAALLRAGEHLHTGKNTVFGLGQYHIQLPQGVRYTE